ncbi:hypothetical protein ACIGCM_03820 [Pseudomonas sp. NPDC078700]|uniref:hypothetical protein n=1 Tax=Pseudomonas sp. NPDC078700 TaxID=3364424 RepID=UPI0037C4FAE2
MEIDALRKAFQASLNQPEELTLFVNTHVLRRGYAEGEIIFDGGKAYLHESHGFGPVPICVIDMIGKPPKDPYKIIFGKEFVE